MGFSPQYLNELNKEYRDSCPQEWYDKLDENRPDRPHGPIIEDFCEAVTSFIEDEDLAEENYENQIRALYEYCGRNINANLVYNSIGCSESYARRFSYDAERGAYEKEWSKSTQKEKVSPGTRDRILKRDESCLRCGSKTELEVHHILPVRAGGENDDSNLATLCEKCHRAAHAGSKTTSETAYNIQEFEEWLDTESEKSINTDQNTKIRMEQAQLSDF